MKKLKKILLINWLYFSKQIIEVDDINFLTGKNGAGKSTVIDALQIVLLGETSPRNFNQAANEKSQRTLDGYLRADMDENNPYSRRGKDFSSYIACEFWDDVAGTQFVTGIVFDCRSDGSRRDHFFIFDGVIPESCFIEQGEAIDISALRSFLKQTYGLKAKLYDSQKQYRVDMLAKWNVHNEQVTRMMKKAVSFRPIVDIQRFITENICDIPEKPDIDAMQQNIRDYKRHELLAQRQEEKLTALQEIGKLHRDMQQSIERWRIQSFLTLWAQKEVQQAKVNQHELEKEDCIKDLKSTEQAIVEIADTIQQKESRRRELDLACAQSSVFQEEEKLSTQKQTLLADQSRLMRELQSLALEIKRESLELSKWCGDILGWESAELTVPVQEAAEQTLKAYGFFSECNYEVFAQALSPFEVAQEAVSNLLAAVRNAAHKVEDMLAGLKEEADHKQAALENLRRNVKDYPRGLLKMKEQLSSELEKKLGQPVEINILADVLEIRDEHWRGAVEGYLNTQKFYLLVDPRYYREALNFYNHIKKDYASNSFGIVDIGKLREKERGDSWPDSLAQKVDTENEWARDYMDYLLGRVVCCAHVDQLRKHRIAITADGMLYQGYVARPLRRELMQDAFIGRRAVELRIRRLEEELSQMKQEIVRWTPIYRELARQHDPLFTQRFVQSDVQQSQDKYLRGIAISTEVKDIDDQLSKLDLMWLQSQRKIIQDLSEEIAKLQKENEGKHKEIGHLEERIKKLEYDELPEYYQQLEGTEDRLREEFSSDYQIQIGVPRYEQELTRLKRASTVLKNFGDQLARTENERRQTQDKLRQARINYAEMFKCSFRIDTMDNDEYEAELRILEESELPKYREKIQAARESAMEQFQNDFLAKLKSSIEQVQDQVKSLNKALKQAQFGTDKYQFRADRNPDYAEYYDMIMDLENTGDAGLFALPFQQKYGKLIEALFSQIAMSDDTQLNARKQSELQQNIERFTDFRTYLKFDLETTDQNGSKQLLSQTLNTKSGGETQTPFYIAVLASFAQLYQVNNLSGLNNTVRLVVFDEAFNKMDSERIVESVRLLRKMGLQAIICTPPDKLSDIMPLADQTHLVIKDKYRMHIQSWGKETMQ